MGEKRLITGPTFAEMLDPARVRADVRERALRTRATDPLDPINLFNISWKDGENRIYHEVLPRALTGVLGPIASSLATEITLGIDFMAASTAFFVSSVETSPVRSSLRL